MENTSIDLPQKTVVLDETLKRENEWKRDVHRLIRRAEIFKSLGKNLPLEELIGTVREHERHLGVDVLIDRLVSDELIIDPRVYAVLSELYEELIEKNEGHKKYPEIRAFRLMGSAIHGGAAIRQIVGQEEEPDLDWGVIVSKKIHPDKLKELTNEAEKILLSIAKKHGLGENFHSCNIYNPAGGLEGWSLDLKSPSEATTLIKNILRERKNLWDNEQMLASYFNPSYPKEINEKNREYVLGALRHLFKESINSWEKIIGKLAPIWEKNHDIKEKHFYDWPQKPPSDRDKKLVGRVGDVSGRVMGKTMRLLLESTKN